MRFFIEHVEGDCAGGFAVRIVFCVGRLHINASEIFVAVFDQTCDVRRQIRALDGGLCQIVVIEWILKIPVWQVLGYRMQILFQRPVTILLVQLSGALS